MKEKRSSQAKTKAKGPKTELQDSRTLADYSMTGRATLHLIQAKAAPAPPQVLHRARPVDYLAPAPAPAPAPVVDDGWAGPGTRTGGAFAAAQAPAADDGWAETVTAAIDWVEAAPKDMWPQSSSNGGHDMWQPPAPAAAAAGGILGGAPPHLAAGASSLPATPDRSPAHHVALPPAAPAPALAPAPAPAVLAALAAPFDPAAIAAGTSAWFDDGFVVIADFLREMVPRPAHTALTYTHTRTSTQGTTQSCCLLVLSMCMPRDAV